VGSGQRAVNVYNEAGTYTITLIATDENGLTLSHSEQITVHPNPTADFEIADGDIYNYSTGAESYTWKLLREDSQRARKESNSISTDFQPALSSIALAKEGHLTPDASYLTLISTNSYGCSDTTLHILPLSPSPSLRFPNAFSPNPNGSIGGYYNANEPNNQIFYPKHAEKPSSYNLQIFNKVGELIFETNEIEIGWDGYYKEAHSAQGVYIYQCTGTWKNGDSYNYRGDITILWTEN
jgi:PKD repeat protein